MPMTTAKLPVHLHLTWEIWLYGLLVGCLVGWSFRFVEFWMKNTLTRVWCCWEHPDDSKSIGARRDPDSIVLPPNLTCSRWVWKKRKKHQNWWHCLSERSTLDYLKKKKSHHWWKYSVDCWLHSLTFKNNWCLHIWKQLVFERFTLFHCRHGNTKKVSFIILSLIHCLFDIRYAST